MPASNSERLGAVSIFKGEDFEIVRSYFSGHTHLPWYKNVSPDEALSGAPEHYIEERLLGGVPGVRFGTIEQVKPEHTSTATQMNPAREYDLASAAQ